MCVLYFQNHRNVKRSSPIRNPNKADLTISELMNIYFSEDIQDGVVNHGRKYVLILNPTVYLPIMRTLKQNVSVDE